MKSALLWHVLKHPLEGHPLYNRVTAENYDFTLLWSRRIQNLLTQGQLWVWPMLFMLDIRATAIVVLGGTFYGTIWATAISSEISSERAKQTYDLLCLTPDGRFGTVWAIITGCIHRERAFETANSLEAWAIRILMFIPFIVSFDILLNRIFFLNVQMTVFWLAAATGIYILDHVQSIEIGCLWGAISAHLNSDIDRRISALTGFLVLQFSTYLVVLVVCMTALPGITSLTGSGNWFVIIGCPAVTLVVFYFVREFVIRRLWIWFDHCLGTTHKTADVMSELQHWLVNSKQEHDNTQVVVRT